MNMFAGIAIAAAAAWLLILYMRRPRVTPLRLSIAPFIREWDVSALAKRRWHPSAPWQRWRIYLRLALLGALALAWWDPWQFPSLASDRAIGLRIVVDTSFSMSTRMGDGSRADAIAPRIAELLANAKKAATDADVDFCSELTLVDNEIRVEGEMRPASLDPGRWVPRPRGGSATLLLSAAYRENSTCPITTAVVLSDLAKPVDRLDQPEVSMSWLVVGASAPNLAVAAVRDVTREGQDTPRQVEVEVRGYAAELDQAQLLLVDPEGASLDIAWLGPPIDGRRSARFTPPVPGRYRLILTPEGDYRGDDHAWIDIPRAGALNVAWNLAQAPMPKLANWRSATTEPDLWVGPWSEGRATTQSGASIYTATSLASADPSSRVDWFVEDHPVLRGINLDVVERELASLASLPAGFSPILAGVDAEGRPRVWAASRTDPPSLLLPEPSPADQPNLAWLMLFNGIDWLVGATIEPPRLTLATGEWQEIPGAFGESDTSLKAVGDAPPTRFTGAALEAEPSKAWPWLVVLALGLIAAERLFAGAWRGADQ